MTKIYQTKIIVDIILLPMIILRSNQNLVDHCSNQSLADHCLKATDDGGIYSDRLLYDIMISELNKSFLSLMIGCKFVVS